jgi:hypothetical protein
MVTPRTPEEIEARIVAAFGVPPVMLDREPTPAPPAGQTFAPKLLHDRGACGLCDALREGAG